MIFFIFFVIGVCIIIAIASITSRNDEINELCLTQSYVDLRNLLEDCTLVNEDYPIQYIRFEQETAKSFFRYYIRFCDLGMFLSPQKAGLENCEAHVLSEKQKRMAELRDNSEKNVIQFIAEECQRDLKFRKVFQKDFDDRFFETLFKGKPSATRNFEIASPFESYASSGGKYIFDTDYWEIDEDDAVYHRTIGFYTDKSEIIPYVIEKATKELFPNAHISRYSSGCYINL